MAVIREHLRILLPDAPISQALPDVDAEQYDVIEDL